MSDNYDDDFVGGVDGYVDPEEWIPEDIWEDPYQDTELDWEDLYQDTCEDLQYDHY